MAEQLGEGLPIRQGERRRQHRSDVRAQMIRVAGAEENDIDTRLVAHKAIGRLGDRARARCMDQEAERVRSVGEPAR